MNVSAWSGWHWVIVALTGLLAAEHSDVVASALGSADAAAIFVTTSLLGIVGIISPSASVKK